MALTEELPSPGRTSFDQNYPEGVVEDFSSSPPPASQW